ncbi:hypothetical protein EV121DRAFT_259771, partial [Schizophyllum commune]
MVVVGRVGMLGVVALAVREEGAAAVGVLNPPGLLVCPVYAMARDRPLLVDLGHLDLHSLDSTHRTYAGARRELITASVEADGRLPGARCTFPGLYGI